MGLQGELMPPSILAPPGLGKTKDPTSISPPQASLLSAHLPRQGLCNVQSTSVPGLGGMGRPALGMKQQALPKCAME